jgi:hypothetical protein
MENSTALDCAIEKRMIGKIKMNQSFHTGVTFLNPGDTFLLEEKHWETGAAIARYMEECGLTAPGKKSVVAISGPSGSGKSEVGYCIGAFLGLKGLRSVCYSTDNCYTVPALERGKLRSEAFEQGRLNSIIGYKEYNWALIGEIERGVRTGARVETPVIDITKDDRPISLKEIDYGDFDVLLLDGLYALAGTADIKICLEQSWEGVLHAQKERGKESVDPLRLEVMKLEMDEVFKLANMKKDETIMVSPVGEITFP